MAQYTEVMGTKLYMALKTFKDPTHQWCYKTLILNCGSYLTRQESSSWLCYWLAVWPCHLASQLAPFLNEDNTYPPFYKVLSELWVNIALQVVSIICLLTRAGMCITPLKLRVFIICMVTIVSVVGLCSEERRYRTGNSVQDKLVSLPAWEYTRPPNKNGV